MCVRACACACMCVMYSKGNFERPCPWICRYMNIILPRLWFCRFQKIKDIKVSNPRLKTLIAVGGWNAASSEFTKMVESMQNRQKFIESTLSFLRNYSFDGLDLDWEYPTLRGGRPQDKGNLVLLVRVSSLWSSSCRLPHFLYNR